MTEKMIIRQNKDWQVGFWATDPNDPESEEFQPVHGLHEITPYGMMLASLGSCTAQVVLSYAQHHQVAYLTSVSSRKIVMTASASNATMKRSMNKSYSPVTWTRANRKNFSRSPTSARSTRCSAMG